MRGLWSRYDLITQVGVKVRAGFGRAMTWNVIKRGLVMSVQQVCVGFGHAMT